MEIVLESETHGGTAPLVGVRKTSEMPQSQILLPNKY